MTLYIIISSTTGAILNLSNYKHGHGSRAWLIAEGAIKGPLLLPYIAWLGIQALKDDFYGRR